MATAAVLATCKLAQPKIAETSCPLRISQIAAISRCLVDSGRSAARAFSSRETSSRKRTASSVPDPVSETWQVRRSVSSRTRATSARSSARSISPDKTGLLEVEHLAQLRHPYRPVGKHTEQLGVLRRQTVAAANATKDSLHDEAEPDERSSQVGRVASFASHDQ